MRKIVAVVLIAIIASVILSVRQSTAQAQQIGQSGEDFSGSVGWPGNNQGNDWYCLCIHTCIGTDDDCCVGIGMQAHYDYCAGLWGFYYYQSGQWSFDADVGAFHRMPNWYFYPSTNSHYGENEYYDYSDCSYFYYGHNDPNSPDWTGGIWDEYGLRFWVPGPTGNQWDGFDAYYISGYSSMYFQDLNNFNNIQYMDAAPSPYYLLTAQAGPPNYFEYHYWT